MNMSDDIASSVLQVSVRGAETAMHLSESVMEAIMKLLKYIAEQKAQNKMKTDVKNKEINDIKAVKYRQKNCLNIAERTVKNSFLLRLVFPKKI